MHDWNAGFRLNEQHGDEHAVVPASLCVLLTGHACILERFFHGVSDLWAPWCVVFERVRFRWEAVVVVVEAVFWRAGNGYFGCLPVRGYEDDGFGCFCGIEFEDLGDPRFQRFYYRGVRWVAEDGHGAAAVRERDYGGEARHVGGFVYGVLW